MTSNKKYVDTLEHHTSTHHTSTHNATLAEIIDILVVNSSPPKSAERFGKSAGNSSVTC